MDTPHIEGGVALVDLDANGEQLTFAAPPGLKNTPRLIVQFSSYSSNEICTFFINRPYADPFVSKVIVAKSPNPGVSGTIPRVAGNGNPAGASNPVTANVQVDQNIFPSIVLAALSKVVNRTLVLTYQPGAGSTPHQVTGIVVS